VFGIKHRGRRFGTGKRETRWRLPLASPVALAVILHPVPAAASGGAHVVDDAAVETSGTCHLENWATFSSGNSGLLNIGPGCTRTRWPNLEIGGFVTHAWTQGSDETTIGLSPKLVLRSEERGWGVAVSTSVGLSIDRGRIETLSAIVPLTIPAGDRVRLNFNLGWHWSRTARDHAPFVGAQAEIAIDPHLNLMVEGFARDSGKAGGQIGLRWTPGGGRLDFDLIAGRYVDGATRNAVTIGLTMRR
jgi:hypothetical protein